MHCVKAKSDLTHHSSDAYSPLNMSNHFPTSQVTLQRAGRAIGLVRFRSGHSPAEAADAAGWSVKRLAEMEAGERNATWLDTLELLTALGASLEDLAAAWSEVGDCPHGSTTQRARARS